MDQSIDEFSPSYPLAVSREADSAARWKRTGSEYVATRNGQRPAGLSDGALRHQVYQSIGAELGLVEEAVRGRLASRYVEVSRLTERAVSMGGKRLRPMLVLLAAQACQRRNLTEREAGDLRQIAVSVELVHAASLVHDDVMDHADLRRHTPTIHATDGNSAAILLGDYLFTKAYAAAACCRSAIPARAIAKAASELCEGELRQQASSGNWEIGLREYRSILQQKTASLCAVSCRLGAWQARGSMAEQRALGRFGSALGLAFQIADDWLDYFGTPEVGKTLGTDLMQLKPTLPLLYFLRDCSPEVRREALAKLSGNADQRQLVACWVRESRVGGRVLETAQRMVHSACDALQHLPSSAARDCLAAVAEFSAARTA